MKINELSVQQLEEAASILKAIAHPFRMSVISVLEEGQWLTVGEIQKQLQAGQAAVSHHLGILKDKGVLVSKREGRNIFYGLKHSSLSGILSCVGNCTGKPPEAEK
jgi:DNA-binding transcriptional ArsR family regulator